MNNRKEKIKGFLNDKKTAGSVPVRLTILENIVKELLEEVAELRSKTE